jgi:hypothetical protein
MTISIFFEIFFLLTWQCWKCSHSFCSHSRMQCSKNEYSNNRILQCMHSIDISSSRDTDNWSSHKIGIESSSNDRHKKRNEMPLSQRWYKARQQHLSKAQKLILRSLWSSYGITLHYGETIDAHLSAFFDDGCLFN